MIKLDIFLKKVESEGIINTDTTKQEIKEDILGRNNIDDDEVNPYHEIITNKIDKEEHYYITNGTMVNIQ